MRFLISLYMSLLLLINCEMINGQTYVPPTSNSDPCYNYSILNDYWRNVRQSYYSSYNDTHLEWNGWYRLYLNGESAQMSEWCVNSAGCGGETGLYLNGSHPRLEDGVVTHEVLGTQSWYWSSSWQCGDYRSNSIQVKACPGVFYVYKLVKPDVSIPSPTYCAVAFKKVSNDPCYNYESLDRPWRATNESGLWICDGSFSWNGWYRLFYNGMNIQISENCVSSVYGCNTDYSLWLNGPHPQIEDGVVTREVCGSSWWSGCCNFKSQPIRVKACPGNYYVYELVNPQYYCAGYCTDVSTISQNISSTSPPMNNGSNITLDYDPCYTYNILNNHWRSTHSYYGQSYDDTRIEWNGWYRLFIGGTSAQMPEWSVTYMSCGGYSSLWLGESHPQIEDGVVTREVYGSIYYNEYSTYRSNPIQVKACPGNYYVYKFTRPKLSIPAPVYCAVSFTMPIVDPCYNYTSLDEPWRATDNPYHSNYYYYMCDYNVNWNGWYRLFYNGQSIQMPESCVNFGMCGTYYSLWLNDTHPQLEDGVVTRHVCGSDGNNCCGYRSHPIQVKACPGDYYVYEFVRPLSCAAYCADVTSHNTTSTTTETIPPTESVPVPITSTEVLPVDPCLNYNVLDDPWRSTNNQNSSQIMCDHGVSWSGWYRLFIEGQSVQMPDTCVDQYSCGTHAPLWLNGQHPRVEDGEVTRDVCGHWNNDCCSFQSNPIKVKACPGNYYVYELVTPTTCSLAYCAEIRNITVIPETTVTMENMTDPCADLNCTEDEWCGKKNGFYGCFCNENHPRPEADSFDSSETCESSSGSMSLSRCQLFEAGFPAGILHLNEPSCKGTVRNGRVEFSFDNDEHICGTNLVANGTHFIYENFILGAPDSSEGPISRKRILKLAFSCVYLQTQTLSMNMEINPLESIVHRTLPAGEGRYQVRMVPYHDAEFSHPFTGSVDAELNQQIFVEVRVDGVDNRQFAVVTDTCWATPENDPHYHLRWDLIAEECPSPNDDSVELLQNGVSTSSRFSFRMFVFTTNSTKVYLHCAVHLCLLMHSDCSAHCYPGYQRRVGRSLGFHDSASISMGPLVMSERNSDTVYGPQKVKVSEAPGLCSSLMIMLLLLLSSFTIF